MEKEEGGLITAQRLMEKSNIHIQGNKRKSIACNHPTTLREQEKQDELRRREVIDRKYTPVRIIQERRQ